MIWGLVIAVALGVGALWFVLATDGRYFGKPLIRWIYDHWGAAIFGTRSEPAVWHALADELALRGDERVLDVGTAIGDWPLTLAARTDFRGQVVGVDWSPHMMAAARTEADVRGVSERVQFQVVDVRDGLPFANGQFDVVTCIGLLETWPHPEHVFAELVRVLKPEGVVVLSLYKGSAAWSARLTREWYIRTGADHGLDSIRVIPSRRSQDLVLLRRSTLPVLSPETRA